MLFDNTGSEGNEFLSIGVNYNDSPDERLESLVAPAWVQLEQHEDTHEAMLDVDGINISLLCTSTANPGANSIEHEIQVVASVNNIELSRISVDIESNDPGFKPINVVSSIAIARARAEAGEVLRMLAHHAYNIGERFML